MAETIGRGAGLLVLVTSSIPIDTFLLLHRRYSTCTCKWSLMICNTAKHICGY